MASIYWVGDAAATAQVSTLTVGGTIEIGDLFIVTIGSKSVSVAATTTSTATTATEIFTALTELDPGLYPEFSEVTWDNDTASVVTGTGAPGVPFTATASTTESNGGAADTQTFVAATPTAASGPNYASVGANWSGGAVPADDDTVIIADSSVDILYGLDALQISGLTLTAFTILASFTGRIGLPLINENGYEEYRPRYLKVGMNNSSTVQIGAGPGQGSSRLYIDFETSNTLTVKVHGTGQPESPEAEALRLLANHSGTILEIASGSVGLAREPTQTSTVSAVRIEFLQDQAGDVTFRAGSGCNAFNLTANGGSITTDNALGTVTLLAGDWLHTGGAITAIVNTAGAMTDQSAGTISAYTGRAGSVYDHRGDFRPKTYTAVDLYAGATWLDPNAAANTYTASIDLNQCSINDVTLDIGVNRRLALGSVA